MNIQIFGKVKCFATKSAERFFKERKIRYQFINILEKGLSKKELDGVVSSIGNVDLLFDVESALYETLNIAYISRTIDDKKELLLTNPCLLVTPIVRDCDTRSCTIGNEEKTWKLWVNKS